MPIIPATQDTIGQEDCHPLQSKMQDQAHAFVALTARLLWHHQSHPEATNYPEKGKSKDPKRHAQGPMTSEKQSPLQICK
jgi:hypothetical protein